MTYAPSQLRLRPIHRVGVASLALFLSSCSGLRTENGETIPLLNALFSSGRTSVAPSGENAPGSRAAERLIDSARVTERLIAVAADPEYQSPPGDDGREEPLPAGPEAPADTPSETDSATPSLPLRIGDIFRVTPSAGMDRQYGLFDGVDEDAEGNAWAELDNIAPGQSYRIPLTISQDELEQLRQTTPGDRVLPTRSVALDFESRERKADTSRLSRLLTLSRNEQEEAGRPEEFRRMLGEIRDRVAQGETLHIVTGVTESEELLASFPGAPVGRRDEEPVGNAVEAMFPQLGDLDAEKANDKIRITRQPAIYWNVEMKPLRLDENGDLAIAGEPAREASNPSRESGASDGPTDRDHPAL